MKIGLFQRAIAYCQGRHTLFCVSFFVSGTALQIVHRLDGTYISFMTVLLGFVLGHSIKEDHYAGSGSNGSDGNSDQGSSGIDPAAATGGARGGS